MAKFDTIWDSYIPVQALHSQRLKLQYQSSIVDAPLCLTIPLVLCHSQQTSVCSICNLKNVSGFTFLLSNSLLFVFLMFTKCFLNQTSIVAGNFAFMYSSQHKLLILTLVQNYLQLHKLKMYNFHCQREYLCMVCGQKQNNAWVGSMELWEDRFWSRKWRKKPCYTCFMNIFLKW